MLVTRANACGQRRQHPFGRLALKGTIEVFSHPTAVYLFRSSSKQSRYGATLDPTGANLPAGLCENGKWQRLTSLLVRPGEGPPIALITEETVAALEVNGWHVWEIDVTVTSLDVRSA